MSVRVSKWLRVTAFGAIVVGEFSAPPAEDAKRVLLRPVADLKWEDSPMVPGAKVATIWGDPAKGAYGALKRIPMGVALPTHTHSRDQTVIVVAGTIALSIEGGPLTEMGPGSYAVIPAGVKHAANCHTGVDCIYFEEQPGAADMKTVGASSKR